MSEAHGWAGAREKRLSPWRARPRCTPCARATQRPTSALFSAAAAAARRLAADPLLLPCRGDTAVSACAFFWVWLFLLCAPRFSLGCVWLSDDSTSSGSIDVTASRKALAALEGPAVCCCFYKCGPTRPGGG